MRTNIEIDDALMAEALERTGYATKKQVVDEALRALVMLQRQGDVRKLRGKVTWEGDLDDMRTSKYVHWDVVPEVDAAE